MKRMKQKAFERIVSKLPCGGEWQVPTMTEDGQPGGSVHLRRNEHDGLVYCNGARPVVPDIDDAFLWEHITTNLKLWPRGKTPSWALTDGQKEYREMKKQKKAERQLLIYREQVYTMDAQSVTIKQRPNSINGMMECVVTSYAPVEWSVNEVRGENRRETLEKRKDIPRVDDKTFDNLFGQFKADKLMRPQDYELWLGALTRQECVEYFGDPEIQQSYILTFYRSKVTRAYRDGDKLVIAISAKGKAINRHRNIGWSEATLRRVTERDCGEMLEGILRRNRQQQLKRECLQQLRQENPLIYSEGGVTMFYCPLCNRWHIASDYLRTVFKDNRELWLANMVTHYRHEHITSWNKMWGRYGHYYQEAAHFHDYDEEKHIVNERAKRQIIRKATDFLRENGITPATFRALQFTTEETMALAEKKLL